jgi:hypothetical protein
MIKGTMLSRSHLAACCAACMAVALAGCGYVGRELLAPAPRDAQVDLPDGGRDGGVNDGGEGLDAQLTPDAAMPDAAAVDASSDASGGSDDAALADAALSDAQADGAASSADSAVPDAGPLACDLTGTYAVKVSVTVSWPASFIEAGTAGAELWLRLQATQSGSTMSGTLLPCGFQLPDFALPITLGSETYGMRFRDTLFDTVPSFLNTIPASFTIGGASVPGAALSLAPTGMVVGTTLANPTTDIWPANSALANVDTDVDGNPGVTAIYLNDATHVYPPANFIGSHRSDLAYAAARFAFSASGSITSCTELGGGAAVQHFDTHVRGCHIAGAGDCTTTQRDFVDANRPIYVPLSASYQAIKIAAGTTCTQLRALLP